MRSLLYVHLFEQLKSRHLRLIRRLHPKWAATLDRSLRCDSLGLSRFTIPQEGGLWGSGDRSADGDDSSRECLHIIDLLFRILELGGIPAGDIDRSYFHLFAGRIPASGPEFSFLRSPKPDTQTIIFNPYGASSSRRLSERCMIRILEMLLRETNVHIVLWAGPGDQEHSRRLLAEHFSAADRIAVTGPLSSVTDVIVAMASCDAMIGVDTGSAHVAACYNIPELTFYQQNRANFTRWHARSPRAINVILPTANFAEADPAAVTDAVQNFLAQLQAGE